MVTLPLSMANAITAQNNQNASNQQASLPGATAEVKLKMKIFAAQVVENYFF